MRQSVLQDFLSLIMRHWNVIADTLHSGDVFLPLLLDDENGISHANDWAKGFLQRWSYAKQTGLHSWVTKSMAAGLCRFLPWRTKTTPTLKCVPTKAISAEDREKLIVGVAAGVMGFTVTSKHSGWSKVSCLMKATTFRRAAPKIGRNDPCPCGSGKKYKHCCGGVTIH